MPAYVVGVVHEVRNAAQFAEYRRRLPDNVSRHDGRAVVVAPSDAAEILDGESDAKTLVLLEFESVAAAKAWYEADDFRELKELRQRSASVEVLLVQDT